MSPPKNGPSAVPKAIVPNIGARNFPLSRSGSKSQIIISIRTFMPPDPNPCIALPAINIVIFVAPPQIPLPSTKVIVAISMGHRRPKMLASCPNRGWNAVLEACQRVAKDKVRYLLGEEEDVDNPYVEICSAESLDDCWESG